MIDGVAVKELTTHRDERGFFRELVRVSDDFFAEGFGQWSHSLMYAGVIKAWHVHRKQVDWWYVCSGVLKVALYDTPSGLADPRPRLTRCFWGIINPPGWCASRPEWRMDATV